MKTCEMFIFLLYLAQKQAHQIDFYLILWNLVKMVWLDLNKIVCVLCNYAVWVGDSLVSPVSLSLLQTLVIFPRSANINHQGTEISQLLSVLPHLGAWEKARFFQNDGLTECKITRFVLLQLTLLKMR